jgi:uncharacterized membrane protein YecN with MAPEG domain
MFKTHTRRSNATDGPLMGAASRLLHGAGATGTSGRVLHADNFHTLLKVMMKHTFTSFCMLLVGT